MADFHEKQVAEKQEPVLTDIEGLESDGDVSITALVAAGEILNAFNSFGHRKKRRDNN
jgi:hypothetical protein